MKRNDLNETEMGPSKYIIAIKPTENDSVALQSLTFTFQFPFVDFIGIDQN